MASANRRQFTHGSNPRLLTPQNSTRAYFSHSLERFCNNPAPDGFSMAWVLRNSIAVSIRLAIVFCNAVRGPFLFRPHTDHSPWSLATPGRWEPEAM